LQKAKSIDTSPKTRSTTDPPRIRTRSRPNRARIKQNQDSPIQYWRNNQQRRRNRYL